MARKHPRTPPVTPPPPTASPDMSTGGEFTGKFIVLLRDDGLKEGLQAIKQASGLTDVCSAADYEGGAVEMAQAHDAEVFVLDKLKVAVVDADPTQVVGLRSA